MDTTSCSSVDKVIEALGGLTKAASALGIENPSVVANWRTRGRVPAERTLEIEAISGISRHELRPDVFGAAPQPGEAAA
jgi:DNA-binding transcriptional regulator YdaS (Cro superfamily)